MYLFGLIFKFLLSIVIIWNIISKKNYENKLFSSFWTSKKKSEKKINFNFKIPLWLLARFDCPKITREFSLVQMRFFSAELICLSVADIRKVLCREFTELQFLNFYISSKFFSKAFFNIIFVQLIVLLSLHLFCFFLR